MKKCLVFLLLLGCVCDAAWACTCRVKSFDEMVTDADAIYFATLEDARIARDDSGRKQPFIHGRFDVRRTLKGASRSGGMMLQTGLGGGDCGVPMFVARTYIIFKAADSDGIHGCGGSHAIENFEEDSVAAKVKAAMRKKSSKK